MILMPICTYTDSITLHCSCSCCPCNLQSIIYLFQTVEARYISFSWTLGCIFAQNEDSVPCDSRWNCFKKRSHVAGTKRRNNYSEQYPFQLTVHMGVTSKKNVNLSSEASHHAWSMPGINGAKARLGNNTEDINQVNVKVKTGPELSMSLRKF